MLIGNALEGKRHQVVLATKCGMPASASPYETGLSRRWIMHSIEVSLKKLKTDHIDLYQVHRPDEETPIEETVQALDDAVKQGKVRYVGCSNYAAWQLAEALGVGKANGLAPWISAQNRWNLIEGLDDPHLLPAAAQVRRRDHPVHAAGVGHADGQVPARRGAAGRDPGRRHADDAPADDGCQDGGRRAAASRGLRRAATAPPSWRSAWLLAHQEVSTVIVGARKAEQLAENVKAAEWAS